MKSNNQFFIMSSNCKLVSGAKRSIIINYGRGDIYFISPEYSVLLTDMDRMRIAEIEQVLYDTSSQRNFEEFLQILINHEIGYLSESLDNYPIRSDNVDNFEITPLIDVIIEIDLSNFDQSLFKNLCEDLASTRCKDFQLRCFPLLNLGTLSEIISMIETTSASYVEVHCNYSEDVEFELHRFVEKHAVVSNVYVYDAPYARVLSTVNETPDHYPLSLGSITFLNYSFNNGDCCGLITKETLDFSNIDTHNRLRTRNGCLDRKLSIDVNGNIKNCPSMTKSYGNIKEVSIMDILISQDFRNLWHINKDQIAICNVCEFRYNCTDCRAFLQNTEDIYSKPLKCGYNPYTLEWEDWSRNSLKEEKNYLP